MISKRISKKLMQALMEKTSLKRPTLYAKIAEIAQADGRSCSNLVYALEYAHRNGLDPRQFADQDVLKEYREYRRSHSHDPIVVTKTRTIAKKRVAGVKFSSSPDIPEVALPSGKVREARKMATVYPFLYVFENSVREFIKTTLEDNHGKNWWDMSVSTETKNKASNRQDKQGASRYYGTKAPHPIYLVDLDDLRNTIIRNWKDFEPKLPKLPNTQAWIINTIQMIEEIRNIVAHNNPISKDDEQKLKVNFKEWVKRIFH